MIRALLFLWLAWQTTVSPEALQHLQAGTEVLKQRRLDVAIAEFRKVTELEPTQAAGFVNLGEAYMENQDYGGAIPPLKVGPIEIDRERRELRIEGDSVHVTTKEFELLAYLADHPGRIFTRDQLLTRIWGYEYVGDGRTVDVHVSWLRSKLRAVGGHNYFRTVRGVGYAFAPPGAA